MKTYLGYIFVVVVVLSGHLARAESLSSYELPVYTKQAGIAGNLLSVGSDTLAGVMSLWVEAFQSYYPNANLQMQASGSSTAPPALIQGTAQLGLMSRIMRHREVDAFEQTYGYPPVALKVAVDAIGIFVHQDNPIQGLNFQQIDAIFSITLRCGARRKITSWSQLGITSGWARRSIQSFGRNAVSGTYGYFKKYALCQGDFSPSVNEEPGSASVVQSVASSINAIGYSGIGYTVSGARVVPIARYDGTDYVLPTHENILSGTYPLARYLYVYLNKNPNHRLSPIEAAFVRFIFSREGQSMVAREGYVPVSPQIAQHELAKVDLD
jgi:phosphate transport system substrate-binding protein